MIVIYVRAADVDAYTTQGWQCWRLGGFHGIHPGHSRHFIAVWTP